MLINVVIAAKDLHTAIVDSIAIDADTSVYPAFLGSTVSDYSLTVKGPGLGTWIDTVPVPAEVLAPAKCGAVPATQTITARMQPN